uniref:ApeA N-terminal domain-containing protein n=1 Tax=Neobacillus citreus TaxID=2833578 RepID=A0A942Y809_9BACI
MKTFRGHWWLPDDPDSQPGTLTISNRGDVTLELIGGFDLSVRTPLPGGGYAVSANERPMPLIYGLAGNQRITVQDALTLHSDARFGLSDRPNYHRISGTRAFVGVHLPEEEHQQLWQGCWAHLENFAYWSGADGVRRSAELRSKSADLVEVPDKTVEVDGWTYTSVTRVGGFDFDVRRGDISVSGLMSARLRIDAPGPCTIAELDTRVKAWMDLLTLASGSACGVIGMSVIPVSDEGLRGGRRRREDYPVHVRHLHEAQPDADVVREWRFTCDELAFEQAAAAWMPLQAKALEGTSAYFGSYYSPGGYTESRTLLHAVAAEATHRALGELKQERDIDPDTFADRKRRARAAMQTLDEREWLDRKLRNDPRPITFRDRLHDIVSSIAPEAVSLILTDVDEWATDLAQTRNGLAHRADGSGQRLHELAQATDAVLTAYLLARLGLNAAVQAKAAGALRQPY